jgi:hypothetical protein
MELRARIRPTLRHAGLMAAAAALLVPASAGTATADAKTHAPVVKRVTPKRVFVGETMTVRGRYFRPGIAKNTVAFRRQGAKVVLVRADKSTRKLLRVKLPKRLEKVLPVQNGTPVETRLQVRVMSTRFGRRYTSRAMSPIVGPERPPAPPLPPTADPNGDCDLDGALNRVDADDDNDLLTDAQEADLSKLLDACKSDTDGDGVEDGYEYQSARDLNDDEHQSQNAYTPYPRKLPYPNPLDGEDHGVDHDGDRLTLLQEFKLWNFAVGQGAARTLERLNYSAGEQYSISVRAGGTGQRTPTLDAAGYDKQVDFLTWAGNTGYATVQLVDITDQTWWDGAQPFSILNMDRVGATPSATEVEYYDFFDNGKLDDSERDEDADGLTNVAESSGCMKPSYWTALYTKESPYPVAYEGTALDDPDTDGDGIRDGADDQDHDDVPNVMECSRSLAANWPAEDPRDPTPIPLPDGRPWKGWVNPFNPCLPHAYSRTCSKIVTIGAGWAPFNTKPEDSYRIYD